MWCSPAEKIMPLLFVKYVSKAEHHLSLCVVFLVGEEVVKKYKADAML